MKIVERYGNIAEAKADVLVNTVNCVGVMGKGVALAFKHQFGEIVTDPYEYICRLGAMRPGDIQLVEQSGFLGNQPYLIVNAATKDDWRNPSRIEWVEQCLDNLVSVLSSRETYTTMAIPLLGCGCGGLQGSEVRSMIEDALADLPLTVYLYMGVNRPH